MCARPTVANTLVVSTPVLVTVCHNVQLAQSCIIRLKGTCIRSRRAGTNTRQLIRAARYRLAEFPHAECHPFASHPSGDQCPH